MRLKWSNVILLEDGIFKFDENDLYYLELNGSEREELWKVFDEAMRRGVPYRDGSVSASLPPFLEEAGLISHEDSEEVRKEDVVLSEVLLEVTPFCPFNCRHCLLPQEYRRKRTFLPLERAIKVVDDTHDLILPRKVYTLTGGEPSTLPREYLVALTGHIRDLGAYTIINTNCLNYRSLLLGDDVILKVSLYGIDERSYEAFTGMRNSFNAVVRCLEKVASTRPVIHVIYTKVQQDMGITPEDMVEFARRFSDLVTVHYSIHDGWGGRDLKSVMADLNIAADLSIAYNDKRKEYLCINRNTVPFPSLLKGCALLDLPSPSVRHDGYVLACPFFDEPVAHIDNPRWVEMYYVKVVRGRRQPWTGGRCNVRRLWRMR
ncbi:MAG: radical SAM protein [Candidatus Korarchaeum sp.]